MTTRESTNPQTKKKTTKPVSRKEPRLVAFKGATLGAVKSAVRKYTTNVKIRRLAKEPSAESLEAMPELNLTAARVVRRGPRAVGDKPATLRLLRMAANKTQIEVSEAAGIAQGELSIMERSDLETRQLQTIRRYVEALGGKLELAAVFPSGERVTFVGVSAT
jgi:hypothetical protein